MLEGSKNNTLNFFVRSESSDSLILVSLFVCLYAYCEVADKIVQIYAFTFSDIPVI